MEYEHDDAGYYEYDDLRKSDNLTGVDNLVRRFGRIIQTLFLRQKYVANGWEKLVNQLIVAYDDLSINPNNFRKAYNVMSADFAFRTKVATKSFR